MPKTGRGPLSFGVKQMEGALIMMNHTQKKWCLTMMVGLPIPCGREEGFASCQGLLPDMPADSSCQRNGTVYES